MLRRKLLLAVAAAAAALTALTAVILYNYKQEQTRPSPSEVNAWVTTEISPVCLPAGAVLVPGLGRHGG